MTAHKYDNLILNWKVTPSSLDKLKSLFSVVHYYPNGGDIPREVLRQADTWFSRHTGIPDGVRLEDVPNMRLLQLTSAGANMIMASKFFQSPRAWEQVDVSTASGIHVFSIPDYIICQLISLYRNMHNQHWILRSGDKWPDRGVVRNPSSPSDLSLGYFSLRGKTAGLLGYGHIGRETARLLQAHGVHVIAANTRGERSEDTGYIVPGTGDKEGAIPSAFYSTADPDSFHAFLSKTDILIASLPSTAQTRYLLKEEHLRALRKNAVFINVGRGDLVSSDALLSVINPHDGAPPHLLGVGLDVTDPEPLPEHHPLFTHPRAFVTPHTSGDFEGYFDAATDLFVENVKNLRRGGRAFNKVDPKKGY